MNSLIQNPVFLFVGQHQIFGGDFKLIGSLDKFGTLQWFYYVPALKSDNLQYNTPVRWADGTNNSLTKRLTFQVFFFQNSLFSFLSFFKKEKQKNKLGRWVVCPISPASYCRLTDFKSVSGHKSLPIILEP